MVYINIPLLRWPLYMYVTQLIKLINVCKLSQQVASCFAKWKYGYERNVERENQLNKYIVRKNRAMLGTYLDNWKIKLLSNNASRHFNVKLLGTFFSEWHTFASGK